MPWRWWRIAVLVVLIVLVLHAFFGFELKWISEALTSVDVWILNNAAYPSLFALLVGLTLGLCLIPEISLYVLRLLRAPAFWDWQKEYDKLSEEDRGIFFQRSESAYETWKLGVPAAPSDMQALITGSEFPSAVL